MALSAALESGGDDFISKPINVEILHSKIKAHLRIRNFNQQLNDKNQKLKEYNQRLQREQKLVDHFFTNALKQSYLDPAYIKYKITPMSAFNGDLLLAERGPQGGLFVVLGDFTGHGLTAAMGTLPVALVFFAMVRKGAPLAGIAREINHKLVTLMPSEMFFAAVLLELSPDGRTITLWAGGMPDGYHCATEHGIKDVIHSRHLPLGILGDGQFDATTQSLSVDLGDKLYLCSDGVIEAACPDGGIFGADRLEKLLSTRAGDKFNLVLKELEAFRGGEKQRDDISFVEIRCDAVPAPPVGQMNSDNQPPPPERKA